MMPLFEPRPEPTVAAVVHDVPANAYRVIAPSKGLFGEERESKRAPHYVVEMLDRRVLLFFPATGETKLVRHITPEYIDTLLARKVWRVVNP